MPASDGCWAEGSASERACAANPSVPCAVEVAPDNRKGEASEDTAPSWFSGRRRRRFRPFTPCGSHRERGAGWTERLSSSSRSPRRRRQARPGLWPGGRMGSNGIHSPPTCRPRHSMSPKFWNPSASGCSSSPATAGLPWSPAHQAAANQRLPNRQRLSPTPLPEAKPSNHTRSVPKHPDRQNPTAPPRHWRFALPLPRPSTENGKRKREAHQIP